MKKDRKEKEFGKEWQDAFRLRTVRLQYPQTIERIETEAKVEVLEEVKRWSVEPTSGKWIPSGEMNGTLLLKLQEMIANLKKKKK